MDIMTLLGWLVGSVLIVGSLALKTDFETGAMSFDVLQLLNFWDITSVAIVFGGTIAALMVSFPAKVFTKVPKHMKIALLPRKYNAMDYIGQIVNFAKEARMNGLLAIEDKLNETDDTFLKNSLMLVVDSVDPEKVKALLETELDYFTDRHVSDMGFYNKMSEYAPAFGMIGTLVGLINLLKTLGDGDMGLLAGNMGVALITTFYGVIIANFFAKPVANILKMRHDEEYLCRIVIMEGVMAIQDGDNPKFIEEKLVRLLPSSQTEALSEDASGSSSKKKGKKKK
ncbi:MAG: MotA/TolQ/ExbB proton channel family protein [Oscillospiraceae bacterium]|jgi:chemotaxis protein MotA|nr:MotA/TolQ/ExbB proton channel family protein [Oscillospiraceae bacterium]